MSGLEIHAIPRDLYYHEVAYVRELEASKAELLAALKRALFVLESPLLNNIPVNGGGAVNAVRAAIAKAEGMG